MDDDLKKDPLMGDSSELDAEVADFGKEVDDDFGDKKPEGESVNIEKTEVEEEPKDVKPEDEPVSEIAAEMDAMLAEEDGGDAATEAEPLDDK